MQLIHQLLQFVLQPVCTVLLANLHFCVDASNTLEYVLGNLGNVAPAHFLLPLHHHFLHLLLYLPASLNYVGSEIKWI